MRPGLFFCSSLMLLLSFHTLADGDREERIYKTQDEQGRTVYSDKPSKSSDEKAQLPPVNAVPEQPISRKNRRKPQEQERLRYGVRIVSPTPDTSVPPGQRDLSIAVDLEPSLRPDHYLVFYMDGEQMT